MTRQPLCVLCFVCACLACALQLESQELSASHHSHVPTELLGPRTVGDGVSERPTSINCSHLTFVHSCSGQSALQPAFGPLPTTQVPRHQHPHARRRNVPPASADYQADWQRLGCLCAFTVLLASQLQPLCGKPPPSLSRTSRGGPACAPQSLCWGW